MTVTTTASTAASLISFTVDTLRDVATNAAASAERGVSGRVMGMTPKAGGVGVLRDDNWQPEAKYISQTSPATLAAQKWNGWGTALKPAHEPIVLARKPLIGTVAENVLKHGTGGLNIDGCRIETGNDLNGGRYREIDKLINLGFG